MYEFGITRLDFFLVLHIFIAIVMYLQCCNSTHAPILLPDEEPVFIGRSRETKIDDKMCSRKQLQIIANYSKKYATVKQLGQNASQIDGIDIGHGKTDKLVSGQILHVVNMKYPHKMSVCLSDDAGTSKMHEKQKSTVQKSDENNKDTGPENKNGSKETKISNEDKTKAKTVAKSSHWSQGLKASMADPDLVVYEDDKVVVIKDKYPKARHHWLVMPQENITNTSQLRSSHLPLLRNMLEIGKNIAQKEIKKESSKLKFRFGYHAVHSMSHLHMHVISQDFDSTALKTKKHWNSFTTEYFVDAEDIIEEVEVDGKVRNRRHMTELLKEPLRCHICKRNIKNMPELKKHISGCG